MFVKRDYKDKENLVKWKWKKDKRALYQTNYEDRENPEKWKWKKDKRALG